MNASLRPSRPLSGRARRACLSLCLTLSAVAAARADDSSQGIVNLNAYVVHDQAEDPLSVLPARLSDSVFGTPQSVLDLPRSVSVLESDLLTQYGVQTVNDFTAVTSGTFTGNYFGIPGAIEVRGGEADNYFRGFRRVENLGNFPTVISSSDYVEIIKGPPPPIYDAGSVGGILNFVPKTAKSSTSKFISHPEGKVTVTTGDYNKRVLTAEYGAPFTVAGKQGGYYAYLSDEDSDSYYNHVYDKDFVGQLAVNLELSPNLETEFGGMFQVADLNQSLGWNRVTQALIDNGTYLAGAPAVNLAKPGQTAITPGDIYSGQLLAYAFASGYFAPIFLYSGGYASQAPDYALDPSSLKLVHLDAHEVMASGEDFAKTNSPTLYFDLVDHLPGGATLKNQSFSDFMDHLKYSSYGFTARYKEYVFENRTTYDGSFELGDALRVRDVGGFAFRYTSGDEGEDRDDFQVENREDISVGPTPNTSFQGAYLGGIPYNWRQIGASGDWGAFGLAEATLWDRVTATVSGREDRFLAHTYGTDDYGNFSYGTDTDRAFTYELSVDALVAPGLAPYLTFDRARYVDMGQGGMIPAPEIEGGSWMQPSALDEMGIKYSGLGGKLYTTLALYRQKKSDYDSLANDFDYYHARGLEWELRYAPDKEWAFTADATWQRTEILSPPFINSVPPSVLGFTDPSLAYGGNFDGLGSQLGLTGPLRVPRPDRVFSLFGTHFWPNGLGLTLGGTYVSAYGAGYFQLVQLPQYVICRATVSYAIDRHWSAMVHVDNLFNQRYFLPQYLFEDTFVSPGEGITGEATLAYKF
jgi:iron complex outermembrane recepter protein